MAAYNRVVAMAYKVDECSSVKWQMSGRIKRLGHMLSFLVGALGASDNCVLLGIYTRPR